jgi:hypothetical protein
MIESMCTKLVEGTLGPRRSERSTLKPELAMAMQSDVIGVFYCPVLSWAGLGGGRESRVGIWTTLHRGNVGTRRTMNLELLGCQGESGMTVTVT